MSIIEIPDSVTEIGNSAFYECKNLKRAIFEGAENAWNEVHVGWDNECLKTNLVIKN